MKRAARVRRVYPNTSLIKIQKEVFFKWTALSKNFAIRKWYRSLEWPLVNSEWLKIFSGCLYSRHWELCGLLSIKKLLTAIIKPIDWLFNLVEGHQLTTLVCPNFPILKICGCPNFNQCGWTSLKEIFGENTGLYPAKMIVLFSSRTNRLQETYIVGNLSLLKPGTIRHGHEMYSNQQLLVKGLTPYKLCQISPISFWWPEVLKIIEKMEVGFDIYVLISNL